LCQGGELKILNMINLGRLNISLIVAVVGCAIILALYLNIATAEKRKDALLVELRRTNEAKLVDLRKLIPKADSFAVMVENVIADSTCLQNTDSARHIEGKFQFLKYSLYGLVQGMRYDSMLFSENLDLRKTDDE
jgi:hypothetical protein